MTNGNSSEKVAISDFILATTEIPDKSIDQSLKEALRAIRQHLGMDIAFLAEFTVGKEVLRHVDSARVNQLVKVGTTRPLEDTYCQRVIDGRFPELIPDTADFPPAMELPMTSALSIGAYVGVPVHLTNGSVYGTLCCISHTPDKTLNERDVGLMRVFADLAGKQIDRDLAARSHNHDMEDRIKSVLNGNGLTSVYQPIYQLKQNKIVGFESLSRFSPTPIRTPDVWFEEAGKVGLGVSLEAKAIEVALHGFNSLPDDVYLSVNVSPEAILSATIENILSSAPLDRIVLEITEHISTTRYHDIEAIIRPLRDKGLRIAVDDAGAGYASFRHILNLAPDLIKLDLSLTRNIDTDRSRRALAAALIRFSEETDSTIIAEGVETVAELEVLRELGVNKAQGYLLGRPMPLASAIQLCREHAANGAGPFASVKQNK
jgi:EAL domain-containing protein (putative c-di-GMP-specific phosphodiesterase class I)